MDTDSAVDDTAIPHAVELDHIETLDFSKGDGLLPPSCSMQARVSC